MHEVKYDIEEGTVASREFYYRVESTISGTGCFITSAHWNQNASGIIKYSKTSGLFRECISLEIFHEGKCPVTNNLASFLIKSPISDFIGKALIFNVQFDRTNKDYKMFDIKNNKISVEAKYMMKIL